MENAGNLFVSNLKRLMDGRKWDALALAQASGITRSGVYKIVKGQRWPSPDNIDRIAKALGVPVAELFVERGKTVIAQPPSPVVPPKTALVEFVLSALNEDEARDALAFLESAVRERRRREGVSQSRKKPREPEGGGR